MNVHPYQCTICGYASELPHTGELGNARGNTERFKNKIFKLWKCPKCNSIYSTEKVDFADIYRDYPLNRKRRLDMFARGTLGNLLKRLIQGGLQKTDSVMDYGCGNGIFLEFLKEKGYKNIVGYDPFVPEFSQLTKKSGGYDCIIANDVIEHVEDPRETIQHCVDLVKTGGLLYVGTADSEGVKDMNELESHIMRLHQPYHRIIISQNSLKTLGRELNLEELFSYRRSYMDTIIPFSNYRFLDEFSRALGHNLDLALDPAASKVLLKRPILFLYAFFGYFIPSAMEPAVLWRKP